MAKDIFVHSRRIKRSIVLKKCGVFIVSFGLLTAAVISFFHIPYFKIKAVSISGAETVRASDIENSVKVFISGREFWVFPRSSIFILSEDMIIKHLTNTFPRLNHISMRVDGMSPAAVLVGVKERTTWAVVCRTSTALGTGKDSCFYSSSEGFLFGLAPKESGSLFLQIKDNREENYKVGGYFIAGDELNRIRIILEKIKSATSENVDTVSISKDEVFYYEAVNDAGWKIIFDSRTDPERAAENFILAYRNTLKEDLSNVDYVDLRFENRIFYKPR